VVAVAAHPDDLEIICGGTLALLVRQGYRVCMIDLTTGEPTPRGSEAIRASEAEAARLALGVQRRICLRLPNRELMDDLPARYALATELRRLRPRLLLACAGHTPAASPDHLQALRLIEAARFYAQLTKWDDRFANTPPHRIPHLVYAVMPFEPEQRHWQGQVVIDISSTFEQKLAAIRAYESQFDAERFEKLRHFVVAESASAGAACGFAYGERFALPQPVGGLDLVQVIEGSKDRSTAARVQQPGQSHLPFG
jgi:bacillithiol biosynthesis deacetylase BshB1